MNAAKSFSIMVNGTEQHIAPGQTLEQFMTDCFKNSLNIVAELNGDIIARERWGAVVLRGSDVLELVHFVGGG